MSNYIVLVKQVPDVSRITDNAFDPETGTLLRTRLAAVINELDTHALALANRMRQLENDPNGQIVCLTMGPPQSAEVLRYSLARAADKAVLLTDRKLGGADTWATANPLAKGIEKIIAETFNGDRDCYILSGMQSVDGDTAQVPPQIAQHLEVPCVTYATGANYNNGEFQFSRIVTGGTEVVRPLSRPAVITVADYDWPVYPSFARTRQALRTELIEWTADDIKATQTGIKGSKTRVTRVFPPGKTNRKCQQIDDVEKIQEIITDALEQQGSEKDQDQAEAKYVLPKLRESLCDRSFEGNEKELHDYQLLCSILKDMSITDPEQIDDDVQARILEKAGKKIHKNALKSMVEGLKKAEPSYNGQVWVIAEYQNGKIIDATYELLGKARELADSLNEQVGVVVAGKSVSEYSTQLIQAGADSVYLIEHPLLEQFDPAAYRTVVADVMEKYKPQIILLAATTQGRTLGPMVSYKLDCGLTADCTGLSIADSSRKGEIGILFQTRPALGGNVMATILTKDSMSQMATARPGVMQPIVPDPSRKGEVINHKVELGEKDLSMEHIFAERKSEEAEFNVEVIIAGGKGMQNRDNYERLVGGLCDTIRQRFDVSVERGGSRAAVEAGIIERPYQVGQTGTAVGPKLYLAMGISGAIQHMIGVQNSNTIVAINTDPNAPILKQCDYYIVGNVEDIVPKLMKLLTEKSGVSR